MEIKTRQRHSDETSMVETIGRNTYSQCQIKISKTMTDKDLMNLDTIYSIVWNSDDELREDLLTTINSLILDRG